VSGRCCPNFVTRPAWRKAERRSRKHERVKTRKKRHREMPEKAEFAFTVHRSTWTGKWRRRACTARIGTGALKAGLKAIMKARKDENERHTDVQEMYLGPPGAARFSRQSLAGSAWKRTAQRALPAVGAGEAWGFVAYSASRRRRWQDLLILRSIFLAVVPGRDDEQIFVHFVARENLAKLGDEQPRLQVAQ
jgi:hypothetical protein